MNRYDFTRKASYLEFGYVYADSQEEALEKILNDDYDDIYDASFDDYDEESIEITGVEEGEEE